MLTAVALIKKVQTLNKDAERELGEEYCTEQPWFIWILIPYIQNRGTTFGWKVAKGLLVQCFFFG